MTKYYKSIQGVMKYACSGRGHVVMDGRVVCNPTDEQLIADGWQPYVPPAPTPEQLLEQAKSGKLSALAAYDSEEKGEVNCFYVNEVPLWVTKDQRTELEFTVRQVEQMGGTEIPYMGFTFTVDEAKQLIAAIEVYALQAYTVTEAHKANINALETVEAVEAYDFKQGYPDKLHFTINNGQ